jgi:hypothetical protein
LATAEEPVAAESAHSETDVSNPTTTAETTSDVPSEQKQAEIPVYTMGMHVKDMAWALIPILLAVLAISGLMSQCRPSLGPTEGPIPSFDMTRALNSDAYTVDFPIRTFTPPEGWTSNSGRVDSIAGTGGSLISRIGMVTAQSSFMEVLQTNATAEELAKHEQDRLARQTGEETVDGQLWQVFASEDQKTVWVADIAGARVGLTGTGAESEFKDLAHAVLAGHEVQVTDEATTPAAPANPAAPAVPTNPVAPGQPVPQQPAATPAAPAPALPSV